MLLDSCNQSVSDWVLRGIPGDCTLDMVEDVPLVELLKKADGGRTEAASERYRLRQRECDADAHRVNSQQWPVSVGGGRCERADREACGSWQAQPRKRD